MTKRSFLLANILDTLQPYLVLTSPSIKSLSALVLLAVLTPALASGQTVQNFIIDPSPPVAPLEKTVDYFTSTTIPSVVLGSSSGDGGPGGYYLYQSANGLNGPWTSTTIDPVGDAYERTRAFTWPGDTFPGFMASRSGQLVWYYNPMNWGGDPTQPWGYQVINPNAGCHDMRIVDVEQSGFPAVVCSSVFFGGTSDFIAFNNGAYNSWTIVDNPFNVNGEAIGDFVAPLSVSGSAAINFVGATTNGIYWFRNPRLVGGNARTGRWTPFLVGGTGTGQAVGEVADEHALWRIDRRHCGGLERGAIRPVDAGSGVVQGRFQPAGDVDRAPARLDLPGRSRDQQWRVQRHTLLHRW
jgi:hypothetical protein